MRKQSIFLVSGLALLVGFGLWKLLDKTPAVSIRGMEFDRIELADTREERARGLSNRTSLNEGHAMLFVFEEAGTWGIWMKDMRFPLDIIWMDDDARIVHLVRSASPDSYPDVFEPSAPAKYVLEMNAGLADRYGLDVGDTIEMSF